MKPLLSAESLKLTSIRTTWLILLILPLVAFISLFDAVFDPVSHNVSFVDFIDVSLGAAAVAAAAFAAGKVGNEFVRNAIALDYLSVPTRRRVVVAKMVVFACAGALVGVAAGAVAHLVATPIVSSRDMPVDGPGTVAARLVAIGAMTALFGAVGVGFALLLRSSTAAVVAVVVWQPVEALVGTIGIGDWLPLGLLVRAVRVESGSADPFIAALLLLGYAGVLMVVVLGRALGRDLR